MRVHFLKNKYFYRLSFQCQVLNKAEEKNFRVTQQMDQINKKGYVEQDKPGAGSACRMPISEQPGIREPALTTRRASGPEPSSQGKGVAGAWLAPFQMRTATLARSVSTDRSRAQRRSVSQNGADPQSNTQEGCLLLSLRHGNWRRLEGPQQWEGRHGMQMVDADSRHQLSSLQVSGLESLNPF